jgi:hypothetical protein
MPKTVLSTYSTQDIWTNLLINGSLEQLQYLTMTCTQYFGWSTSIMYCEIELGGHYIGTLIYRSVIGYLVSKNWPEAISTLYQHMLCRDMRLYQPHTSTSLVRTWGNTSFIPRLYQSQYQEYTCLVLAKNQSWTLIWGPGLKIIKENPIQVPSLYEV